MGDEIDIYARVSRLVDDRQRSVQGQVEDCTVRVLDLGREIGQVHIDSGRSAWNPKVKRPGWDRLMRRLEAGETGGVIVFDLARFSTFEGKTGPYLQYAAVRIQSILRKAKEQGFAPAAPRAGSPEERALLLQLLSVGDVRAAAEEKRAPNMLCDYAFTLAQTFSRFYAAHHILSESDGALRAARLGLAALTLSVLAGVLDILGIAVPVFPRAPGSLASLSLVLPMEATDDSLVRKLAQATTQGARELEARLGSDLRDGL